MSIPRLNIRTLLISVAGLGAILSLVLALLGRVDPSSYHPDLFMKFYLALLLPAFAWADYSIERRKERGEAVDSSCKADTFLIALIPTMVVLVLLAFAASWLWLRR